MAEPYLADLNALVDRLAMPRDIACKHFFSGAAAYSGDQIFMSLTPAGLALKLSPEDLEAAMAAGATSLRYFPKAPVKKDYAVMPRDVVEDDQSLKAWMIRSLKHAGSGNGGSSAV